MTGFLCIIARGLQKHVPMPSVRKTAERQHKNSPGPLNISELLKYNYADAIIGSHDARNSCIEGRGGKR